MSRAFASSLLMLAMQCLVCCVLLASGFLALQALAIHFVDDKIIASRLKEALTTKVLTEETDPTSPFGHTGLKYDMWTECVALGTNLLNSNQPLLERIAETPNMRSPGVHPCLSLVSTLNTGSPIANHAYYRYWHGHQIYLRPLLGFLSLASIHKITAILLLASIAFLSRALAVEFGLFAWVALPIPFTIGTDLLTVPAVTVHALSLIWTFFSVAFAAILMRKPSVNDRALYIAVFASGSVGSYFDLLFNPPMAPTLISFLGIWSIIAANGSWGGAVSRGLALPALWFAGFGMAYCCKWLFAASVMGPVVVFNNVFDQILLRISGKALGTDYSEASPLVATMSQFQDVGFSTIGISLALAVIIAVLTAWRSASVKSFVSLALLCAPLTIPIIWVEVLRNHSIIHAGFVSRTFVLFAVIPLLSALGLLRAAVRCPNLAS